MNDWFDFIAQQALLRVKDMTQLDEGDQSRPALVAMTQHSILEIEGPDAELFLQGQCTADIRRLEQNEAVLAAHCNNKGRMLSSFLAAKSGEHSINLRMRNSIASEALNQLEKYIVFSKAKIRSAERIAISIFGPWQNLWPNAPEPGKSQWQEQILVINHGSDWLELWLDKAGAQSFWSDFAHQCRCFSANYYDAQMVARGLAEVRVKTQQEYLPQQFNYHLLDGVSFKKGCYTGQEIIARMHYKGQVKKQVARLQISGGQEVNLGDKIIKKGESGSAVNDSAVSDSAVGQIVGLAHYRDHSDVLAVINRSAHLEDHLSIAQNSLAKVEWVELPYAIPNE